MPDFLWFSLPAICAALVAFFLTPVAGRLAVLVGAVDQPGERKVHSSAIPRLGGLAVVAAAASVLGFSAWLTPGEWTVPRELVFGLALGILPVLAISLVDDVRSVRARDKFLMHGIGAAIAISLGVSLSPTIHLFDTPIHIGWLAIPMSFLWIVGVTNAFNIIDGLDGLAAGLALISALCMAAIFMLVDHWDMAGVCLVLAGAIAGFLPYNIHPAKIFLGDTGATAIGFSLALFALKGGSTLSTGFAAALPLLVLGLPIADTLVAMARRALRRIEYKTGGVFTADRNHIHHRLLDLGIDHRKAVLILYVVGLILATTALLSVFLRVREAALFVIAVMLAGMVGVQRLGYDEFAFIRRGKVLKVYEMPAVQRGLFVVFVDILFAAMAAYLAMGLKTGDWSGAPAWQGVLDLASTLAPLTVLVFWWTGMYRGSWRVANLSDLTKVVAAVAVICPVGALLLSLYSSRTHTAELFVIYGAVSLILTATARASYVVLRNAQLRGSSRGAPVLLYGAGRGGVAAVDELFERHDSGLTPVGFIDDDERLRGRLVSGLPVLGTSREIEGLLRRHQVSGLLVASSKIPARRLAGVTELCQRVDVTVYRMDRRLERLTGEPVLEPIAIDTPRPSSSALRRRHGSCPSCAAMRLNRSKARTFIERVRRDHTEAKLYRCQSCGWRGWMLPFEPIGAVESASVGEIELSELDAALSGRPSGRPTH